MYYAHLPVHPAHHHSALHSVHACLLDAILPPLTFSPLLSPLFSPLHLFALHCTAAFCLTLSHTVLVFSLSAPAPLSALHCTSGPQCTLSCMDLVLGFSHHVRIYHTCLVFTVFYTAGLQDLNMDLRATHSRAIGSLCTPPAVWMRCTSPLVTAVSPAFSLLHSFTHRGFSQLRRIVFSFTVCTCFCTIFPLSALFRCLHTDHTVPFWFCTSRSFLGSLPRSHCALCWLPFCVCRFGSSAWLSPHGSDILHSFYSGSHSAEASFITRIVAFGACTCCTRPHSRCTHASAVRKRAPLCTHWFSAHSGSGLRALMRTLTGIHLISHTTHLGSILYTSALFRSGFPGSLPHCTARLHSLDGPLVSSLLPLFGSRSHLWLQFTQVTCTCTWITSHCTLVH